MDENASRRYVRSGVPLMAVSATNPPMMPVKFIRLVSSGSATMQATAPVTTR